ncbi:hypothetical protein TB1_024595 [Malus domestica]
MKRKAQEQLEKGQKNHGVHWLRGEMIGEGSFGSVFLATPKKPRTSKFRSMFDLPVVMAVKSAEVSTSDPIQHEAEVLFEIKGCPFVIERFGEEITTTDKGDMVYNLLLEFATGGSLDGLIKKSNGKGLPESDVKHYARTILEGLKHIHKCGYVHCDLTPENILLMPSTTASNVSTANLVAKVADLGLAKRRSRWKGNPMYADACAWTDNAQDETSIDVWSLGCIVLQMLTGKLPCELVEFLDMASFELTPNSPAEISSEARDFLKSCFARRPRERLTAEKLLLHRFVAQPQASEANGHHIQVVKQRKGMLKKASSAQLSAIQMVS